MTATQSAINPKCYDSTGSASVTPNGGKSPYTYSWNTGSTNQTLSGVMAGTYTCVIKDAGGCSFSQSVIITAPTALTIKATTFPATCSYLCNGQAIIVPKGGTNPYNYKWSNGATVASISNLCVGTTYTITVTDAHGCPHDTTINIANPPPIVLTTSNTPSLCNKPDGSASVVASGGTPGYTYLWNTGATATSAALNNITSGNYCVLILDANKCRDSACVNVPDIPGDSIKIVAITNVSCNGGNNGSAIASANGGTTPYTYLWSPSGGATTTANSLTAGTYTIIVTDNNGCKNIAVATITQPPPVIVATPPDTICIGQTATLTAAGSGGTPGYTYLWNSITPGTTYSVSPLTTTNYNVQATDANGCTSPVVPVTVVVRSPLVVVAGPPTNMCAGGSVTLSATGKGGDGTYNYTWSPSTGLNTTTGTTIIASPTVSTTYTVTLTDGCGTPQAQNTVAVIINPSPVVNLIADTLQGCYPLCVKFTDQSTVTGGNIVGWHWTFGDGDTSSNQNPNHCYTKPGVFTVSLSVTSNNGCKSSKIINNYITAYSHPVANFSLSPQPTNIMNSTIYFADHSTDAYGIANWFWQFGDGSDSSGVVKNPQHTYKDTGKYCVNLEVTNVHGCVDTTVQCLEIQPFFVIYVPNAFTPNGNGLNETFTAKGVGILTYEMWIFDRWGQQIYHCNDIYNGWDGKVQNGASGQIAQEDTYVWLIEVTDVLHKNHRYIGRVTLIK
jgi:gliding motility-associated-like protein